MTKEVAHVRLQALITYATGIILSNYATLGTV